MDGRWIRVGLVMVQVNFDIFHLWSSRRRVDNRNIGYMASNGPPSSRFKAQI